MHMHVRARVMMISELNHLNKKFIFKFLRTSSSSTDSLFLLDDNPQVGEVVIFIKICSQLSSLSWTLWETDLL